MLQRKSFVKKTRKGAVLKVVREHYLRDDISSGSPLDPEADPSTHKLSATAPHLLVVDTNIVLQQMDLLEHAAVEDVVVCGIVVEEARHRNQSVHQRLRGLTTNPDRRFFVFANEHHRDTYITTEPGESPNDRNDRAIRVAAAWYAARLPGQRVLLLTNDAGNRLKAQAMGLEVLSAREYAEMRTDAPELADLVAAGAAAEAEAGGAKEEAEGARGGKRKRIYEEHRPMSEITAGIKAGRLHQGTLRVNRFNPYEGWVASEAVGAEILINGRIAMNRALDGDTVAVQLLPEAAWQGGAAVPLPEGGGDGDGAGDGEDAEGAEGGHIMQVNPGEHYGEVAGAIGGKTPTGTVVGIIRRNWRTRGYCGSLQPPRRPLGSGAGPASVLFCPVERRYPMIRLQTRQAATLADKRIVVVIDAWQPDSLYPSGHYVRTLGQIGERDTETAVLLHEHDINTAPFSPAVHACVPPLPWAVGPAELADPQREDLRGLAVCSVDPPGCKDIDDALHVRELPGGNLEVGVHIADVTHFLQPASAMDVEAAERGTTVYLVNRRIDMLPKPLTEDICSLRADVERLAFSVLWEMTPEGDVVGVRFTKSVIKSRAALTYAEAQSRMDDPSATDPLTVDLRRLNAIARRLRAGRAAAGALQLASPEVKFEIDTETHDPLDVGMYQVREANQMVEEMMLLANCTVAERILGAFPGCAMLRRHPPPLAHAFDPLLKAAASAGVALDVSSSLALAQSLDAAVNPQDPYFNTLLRIMATRCMSQAAYFGSGEFSPPEYRHYGLAAPLYTHFTSPIRRYADVAVHRLLAASLGLAPLPEGSRDRAGLRALSANLNERHRNAQMAGRASVELHTLIFFKDKTVLADARITRVRANGLIVFVPKYGIEGPVFLNPKAGTAKPGAELPKDPADAPPEFTLDEEGLMLSSRDGRRQFRVFDPVAVRIWVEEGQGHRRQLMLALADREELPEAERMGA